MYHWASCLPALSSSTPLPCTHFSYIGDCEISVELQKIQAGVNGIQVREDAVTAAPAPALGSGSGISSHWSVDVCFITLGSLLFLGAATQLPTKSHMEPCS